MTSSAVLATPIRSQLRNKYGLPPRPCSDELVHFFCNPCALCQEARELRFRGLYPAPGGRTIVEPMCPVPGGPGVAVSGVVPCSRRQDNRRGLTNVK
eukprot:gene5505-5532_t